MAKNFGFLLFDDVEELDFVGPWEVLGVWSHFADGDLALMSVSEKGGALRCRNGLTVVADYSYADCPALDMILVPGGDGRRRLMGHEPTLTFLRQRGAQCRKVLSVCTGAFLLHAAGLAEGEALTTHWHAMDELRKAGAKVKPERLVRGRKIWSAAGVSAGIDMALALIAEEAGEEAAGLVQAFAEYYPGTHRFPRPKAMGPAYID